MEKANKSREKLIKRCEILEKIIMSISDSYFSKETTNDQKKLLETVLGAAIWYLPHNQTYWTGKISKVAKETLEQNCKSSLTKEHQFPRKIAAKELLQMKDKLAKKEVSLVQLYENKYAKYNLVTPQENKKLAQFQREHEFNDVETAYIKAKVELIEITPELLKLLKKGY
jgi:hypothetical protein